MRIILKENKGIDVESVRHKLKVFAGYDGMITCVGEDKELFAIKEKIFEQQLKELIDKNLQAGWEINQFEEMVRFISELVERGSQALKVDKNKLFSLMVERCSGCSAVNYFTPYNFYDFKSADDLSKQISELNQTIYGLKEAHEKEIIALQQRLTESMNIKVEKVEASGSVSSDVSIWVNCPYCDRYQEVLDLGDWHDWSEEFEGNMECEHCSKIFSVEYRP